MSKEQKHLYQVKVMVETVKTNTYGSENFCGKVVLGLRYGYIPGGKEVEITEDTHKNITNGIVEALQAIEREYGNDRKIFVKTDSEYNRETSYGILTENGTKKLPRECDIRSAKVIVIPEILKHVTMRDIEEKLDFLEYADLMNDYGLVRNVAPLQQTQPQSKQQTQPQKNAKQQK